MSRIAIAMALNFVAGVAYAQAVSIPAQFQGQWATAADCQAAKTTGGSEAAWARTRKIQIEARMIYQAQHSCQLLSVLPSNDEHRLNGTFRCLEEGPGSAEVLNLSLMDGKLSLTDRGQTNWIGVVGADRCSN